MKPCAVIAQDESGKTVCLFVDDKNQMEKAMEVFYDDKALADAGLKGTVLVSALRNPPVYRRRKAILSPVVASVDAPGAGSKSDQTPAIDEQEQPARRGKRKKGENADE
jgi:hypothetical protein